MICRVLLFVMLFTSLAETAGAQSAWVDAAKLRGLLFYDGINTRVVLDTNRMADWMPILARHAGSSGTLSENAVIESYAQNPFLSQDNLRAAVRISGESESEKEVPTQELAGLEFGAVNFTNLADGFARFLVNRTKHELGIAFFQRFREELHDAVELQALFPTTWSVLDAIDEEIYNYQLYLASLRQAFLLDLNMLLDNIPDVVEAIVGSNASERVDQVVGFLGASVQLASQLRNGTHPGELLSSPMLLTAAESIDANAAAGLRILDLLSTSLRSNEPGRYWIGQEELRQADSIQLTLYLALLYQRAGGIAIRTDAGAIEFRALLSKAAPTTEAIARIESVLKDPNTPTSLEHFASLLPLQDPDVRSDLLVLTRNVATLASATEDIAGKKPSTETMQDYFDYFVGVTGIIRESLQTEVFGERLLSSPELIERLEEFDAILRAGANLAFHLQLKQYGAAVVDAVRLLDLTLGSEVGASVHAALLKYGTFMAAITEAETPEEVEDVIEATVLPPGSASIKRRTACNVALQAYMGGGYGLESYRGASNWDSVVGAWAPLGVAISTSSSGCAYTLFVSLLDFGAITLYRFENSEDALPELEFQNLLSPGVAVVVGLPRVPLSLSAGFQLGPELRHVDSDRLELGKPTNRFHFALSVDIPLLDFYTKP